MLYITHPDIQHLFTVQLYDSSIFNIALRCIYKCVSESKASISSLGNTLKIIYKKECKYMGQGGFIRIQLNSKSISEYSPGYYHPHVDIFIACENSAKCYLCDNHGPSKAMYV